MPVFVLEDFRSAFNVGSAYRTAESIAPCAVFPCGISAHPRHKRLSHTARGTQKIVPWRYFDSASDAMDWLSATGRKLVVIETTGESSPLWSAEFATTDAFVFGNEAEGVSDETRNRADLFVSFPQSGIRSCINVSSIIAIIAAEIQRRRDWNS